MKTNELLQIIGEPVSSIIIRDVYGNATLHRNGWWSCDPCYLGGELTKTINEAHATKYPWEGRDYRQHNDHWMPFECLGHKLYARSCGDGVGYFGNCVDAGWVVCFPVAIAPQSMNDQAKEAAAA